MILPSLSEILSKPGTDARVGDDDSTETLLSFLIDPADSPSLVQEAETLLSELSQVIPNSSVVNLCSSTLHDSGGYIILVCDLQLLGWRSSTSTYTLCKHLCVMFSDSLGLHRNRSPCVYDGW